MAQSARKPRAIVVGTGFGCRIHVPALRAAGFEVVGLVGTDLERTRRRAEVNAIPQAFVDLDEAISRVGAHVVTIATPPNTHGPLTLLALARQCHVICEKPFASDATEARAMLDAAKRAGLIHLVGHEFRWQPDRSLVARAIREGLIGQPRLATFIMYHSLVASPEAKMPRWWFDASAGGGWLGASGSHIVDQIRMTLGEFESISAALPVVSARENVAEDSYVVRFRMKNGVEGVMQQSAGAWGPLAAMTRIAGTQGTVWNEGSAVHVAGPQGTRELPVPEDLTLPPPPAPSDDPRKRFSTLELGPYTRLCETLRAQMDDRSARAAVPVPTFEDGLASMQVIDAIRASAAQGGALVRVVPT